MAVTVERLTCPGCGFPIEVGAKEYPAGHPITISSFNSVNDMPLPMVNRYANSYPRDLSGNPDDRPTNQAIGICYLKLKIYDKAIDAFEKAVEDNFDNSETFFYAAIYRLKGKKAFLAARPDIDKALEYLDAAIMNEPKGIYYYFLAYIKYDFFERKYLNTSPNYRDCMREALNAGLSHFDVQQLYGILNGDMPAALSI